MPRITTNRGDERSDIKRWTRSKGWGKPRNIRSRKKNKFSSCAFVCNACQEKDVFTIIKTCKRNFLRARFSTSNQFISISPKSRINSSMQTFEFLFQWIQNYSKIWPPWVLASIHLLTKYSSFETFVNFGILLKLPSTEMFTSFFDH